MRRERARSGAISVMHSKSRIPVIKRGSWRLLIFDACINFGVVHCLQPRLSLHALAMSSFCATKTPIHRSSPDECHVFVSVILELFFSAHPENNRIMSLKPPARDPNAPKRNQSAYLLYQNQMRNTFKEQNPGMTFGQLSKFTSAMYAQISPEEKEVWLQHAEADKQRYLRELDRYEPPPGYDRKGDLVAGLLAQSTRSSGGVQRDPKAPKKNLSAYLVSLHITCSMF